MKDKLTLRATPNDGESSFEIEVNGEGIGQIYNEEADITYEGAVKYGKKIELSFNAYDDLVNILREVENIMSEEIDLSDLRKWYIVAKKFLDDLENKNVKQH